MLSAFEVYTQVMTLSRKLEVQREVQESARGYYRAIDKGCARKGLLLLIQQSSYQIWAQLVIQSGAVHEFDLLLILGYFLKEKDTLSPCSYRYRYKLLFLQNWLQIIMKDRLFDRVRVTSLTFEEMGRICGAGGIGGGINVDISTLPKVRLLMTLEARPGSGISSELIEGTKLHIDQYLAPRCKGRLIWHHLFHHDRVWTREDKQWFVTILSCSSLVFSRLDCSKPWLFVEENKITARSSGIATQYGSEWALEYALSRKTSWSWIWRCSSTRWSMWYFQGITQYSEVLMLWVICQNRLWNEIASNELYWYDRSWWIWNYSVIYWHW